jgi:hydroxyacylglutathione hydrolase
MPGLDIHQFPCLKDNYGVLVHDPQSGVTVSIDAPDAEAVRHALASKGWTLTHILTTHHHADHTAGNGPLKLESGCVVIGPVGEAARIPAIDQAVKEGDTISLGKLKVSVLDTPGHTIGHISYWIPDAGIVFVGDTLFACGCGRVLEGTHEMMWNSLKKIASLPLGTNLYCGHEYTLANIRFALTIEPENLALQQRAAEVQEMRAAGQPTLPTTVGLELKTNVFLRPHSIAIRDRLGMRSEADWRVFGAIRERKNRA